MILAVVGLVIGVQPDEFAWLMLFGELAQNFSHANVRIGFDHVVERIFVDPKFHRLHHMLVDPQRPTLHNCNYGQVLTVWDVLFGTALYGLAPRATGVGDPTVDADNNYGLIGLHWVALKHFWGAVWCRAGCIPGEVAFGENYRPIPVSHIDLQALLAAAPLSTPGEPLPPHSQNTAVERVPG